MRLIIGSVGSSPLTRGTHLPGLKQKDKDRFIPAYAGNSTFLVSFKYAVTVHPRLRGELDLDAFCDYVSDGSSPLTRGTRSASSTRIRRKPVHPRLRGELFDPSRSANSRFPVHPRLRGELQKNNHWQQSTSGSSPLTRGTRVLLYPSCLITRFIPAYAGNSFGKPAAMYWPTVHPRLRGELT